ncbi:MAG TPA: hypothetical protein VGW36_02155 [Pyrinomonadaceae bacterium]|nr:hypothetical protein [Pyrinomonadaceae bacterium]
MSANPKTVEGVYRGGKVELFETPSEAEGARVIVTFVPEGAINLSDRGIDEGQAANLRMRLNSFAEDWELPEMGAYDAL